MKQYKWGELDIKLHSYVKGGKPNDKLIDFM